MNRWILCLLSIWLFACGEEPAPHDSQTIEFTDGPADSLEDYRVRADGMTVWADPVVVNDQLHDDWILGGRTSHSISTISAKVGADAVNVVATSARKFELRLKSKQLADTVADEPLLVRIETTSGKVFHLNLGLTARFRNSTGSSRIYPWLNMVPVVNAGETFLRARVTTRGTFDWLVGSNDDDSEPNASQDDSTHWFLDFPTYALAWAASPTEDALDIHGIYNGKSYRKSAQIHFELTRLGVTNGDPAATWPAPTCTDSIRDCIDDLGAHSDLEACGRAHEVLACDFPDFDAETLLAKKKFANDLRSAIIAHYRVFGADILAAGGNTQQQALLGVDTNRIDEVLDAEEDPEAHDLSTIRVFSHPDLSFPGSDIMWFGAYDRITGNLVGTVYGFN